MNRVVPAFYNLENDISENDDLSARYPDKAKELAKVLSDYLKSQHATMPILKLTGRTDFRILMVA